MCVNQKVRLGYVYRRMTDYVVHNNRDSNFDDLKKRTVFVLISISQGYALYSKRENMHLRLLFFKHGFACFNSENCIGSNSFIRIYTES